MENRILKKVDIHISSFKTDIKEWFDKSNSDICGECNRSEFLKFIFDYNNLSLSKEDFSRRKRSKNHVPCQLRCCARRANGEQCTRRKKDGQEFCGTHVKGTPYGKIQNNNLNTEISKKIEVWVQEINGIQYFIDKNENIYLHEDILNNKINPSIIGKYSKINDKYSINYLTN
tara:strand:- start:282 stop:800 length:519 start_codon:yes stop_codon:yes gene_type:complete